MNVQDIDGDVIPTDFSEHDRLDLIFMRQEALSKRYVVIEQKNGLRHTPDVPVDIDDRFGQAQLKDFFWRITEELTEAAQAIIDHPENQVHTLEELADSLHFLVEAYLLAGISPTDLVRGEDVSGDKLIRLYENEEPGMFEEGCYNVIHSIGCASNCLKQRPWKCTHQLVDKTKFRRFMIQAIHDLIPLFKMYGLTAEQVFQMYWRKSEVNTFRIDSNY